MLEPVAQSVGGALADWRLAVELDPTDIGARYSSAVLLDCEGRLDEAVPTWQAIIGWTEARDLALEAEWPKRELQRLRAALAERIHRSAGGDV
jgi:cytochrome c-type biogenesis protein CcmH/NrfG